MGMFTELRKQETTQQDSVQPKVRRRSPSRSTAEEATPPQVTSSVRTARTVVRRKKVRYAFEFYEDQVETLRRFSAQDRLDGGLGSMSEMVREALDAFIARREKARR